MNGKSPNEKIIFGLKVKQLRQQKGFSFAELAEQTGMSVSYLNEIEKGKKYPKADKIQSLAHTLGIDQTELSSDQLNSALAPIGELLQSNFLNELPLDLFGIELAKVVQMIAEAPAKVNAFISTLLDLSRNYALREENFYFGALRSYLELHNNYFEEIENAVDTFCRQYGIPAERPLSPDTLRVLLERFYSYTIIDNGLDAYPELKEQRAVYVPSKKELLLNSQLTPVQKSFQFGKELGFNVLQLKERAVTSSLLRGRVFEEVLNHSKATYFSVALHLPLKLFVADVREFFAKEKWDGEAFLAIMRRYEATPEMFFHRLTNVLPQFFELSKLFFLRFLHDPAADLFEIDKELHLSRRHQPHGNGLSEHYCRRWVAVSLLNDLHQMQREGTFADAIVRAQLSRYIDTEDEYLCITLARPGYPSPNRNVSVTLGLLLTPELRRRVSFLADPAIQSLDVNKTCERCPLSDCAQRAAPPVVVEKREKLRLIQAKLAELS
ncbi:MAG: helix-turn-helix domain-containing protein [Saprospiraceae bacterium]|jgi:transcriptional regulator with XRE-family HTH domain|nr:helix-turn-helix domain-containing protein [Saprospiraceae bacterium]